MLKKIAFLMAVVMILSVMLVACGEKASGDNDPNAVGSLKIEDTVDDEDNYFYNPKLVAAYRVSDTVVRVKFSPRVTCPANDPAPYIYASTDVFGATKIKAADTKCLDPKVFGEDIYSAVYGSYYDVTFESAIPQDGYICFEETVDTDNDGSLDNVICDDTGAGLYAAYRPIDMSNPVAAVKYSNTVIEVSKVPTVLVGAYLANPENNTFVVEFSKPVTVISGKAGTSGTWAKHCYVADKVVPTPGTDGSWQYKTLFEPLPVDVEVGEDGLMYASRWEFVMDGIDLPETGVFRIVENGDFADSKNENNDNTLGRIVVGIDGVPLEASEAGKGTQDVAHCPYSSDPLYYIKGHSN